jgi:microsomal dipeptidase-like Zn-dependent dipeptidase
MITDLHCHYPMHLVHAELEPNARLLGWWDSVRGELEQGAFDLAARLLNQPGWGDRWRVDVAGLRAGGVGTVCSVLYWPGDELLPGSGAHPAPGSFAHLVRQLDDVEAHLADEVVVTSLADLDRGDLRFVHCVEGGFHLGPDVAAIDAEVGELARRGVLYITLAHLVPRGVAANAPAIPVLSDADYHRIFPQRAGIGLTDLGEAAVRAMVRHHVAVDISHMRQDAIEATLALVAELDPGGAVPVIASHVGVRSAAPGDLEYNLTEQTLRAIAARDGVIGLILSEHLMGASGDAGRSRAIVARHVRAIHDALGTHAHTALGTDLDGFIKPTLHGLRRAADLSLLERWIREDFPGAADGILHENADRVVRRVFASREVAPV